ncbi:MAG: elongation factor G [Verrucomicrobia bacterium]|nr:elongation factor G [Verrucomicrobiota bacterium]
MNDIAVSDVRNFVFLGHTGSGKTTMVDALLFKLGVNDRFGSVAAGSSMADYTEEEKARKITIFAKPFNGTYKTKAGKSINCVFTDTPGYMDFYGQVMAAMKSADMGVVLVDASAGIQVGTSRVWKALEKQSMPRSIVVTGLDKDNTEYSKVMNDITQTYGKKCVPVVIPLPGGKGVLDLLTAKEVPADVADVAKDAKGRLMELAAETNDALLEKYLGGEELTADELSKGLVTAVASGSLVPVFVCMALKDVGLVEFLEGASRLFPSPLAREIKDAEGNLIPVAASEPFVGFVWRNVNDAVGQVSLIRVLAGTLSNDAEIFNASKGQKERIPSLLVINGKKQAAVASATAGDIVAIPKLKVTSANDTVCAMGKKTVCDKIVFPNPVMIMSVTAKTQNDENKIGPALQRIVEEDPTLRFERNKETKETLLMGLGDVHIDVAVGLMRSRSKVEVTLATPKVPYRETVTSLGEGHYKHKKQSGGRGQYAEVFFKVQPKRSTDEDSFEDAIVGGAIPGNFIPAIQKGLAEATVAGGLAGYPVQDVKVTVYDGSFHEVDSSEIAFKIASIRAFRDGMLKAKPVLLEPIMTVKVAIPDHFMGDINGDLNHRRGRILGIGNEDGMQVITAEVPQAELFRYAAELRSITGGRGSFEMEPNRYDIVPSNIAQKIVAAAAANKKEEVED